MEAMPRFREGVSTRKSQTRCGRLANKVVWASEDDHELLLSFSKATGAGECSGFTAAGLGGGHGFLQGRYGLIADNIMQARIVLGNGSVVVTSTTSNSDLFYAIRGAGHNFGILTEMKYKVYDVFSNGNWYYENFIFSGQHIKPLFDQINAMMVNGSQPVELLHYAVFLRIPTIDPSNASVQSRDFDLRSPTSGSRPIQHPL